MMSGTAINYPIDIVIPWVDGNDTKWQKEKENFQEQITNSVHSYNYKDWGFLKYWFRGIEKNALGIRYIFFITWGHIPKWLNIKHPKIKVVKHEDYIPKKYLPTFNSHTIELNLHRIHELSEHFVYFNDDTYLISRVSPDFWFKRGVPCDCAIINPIAPSNRNCISNLQLTTAAVINENFSKNDVIKNNFCKWFNLKYGNLLLLNFLFLPWKKFPGILEKHLPNSFLKSTFEEVWDKEYDLLDETCSHKFRNFKYDVNQWIMREWQVAKGEFVPRKINYGTSIAIRNLQDAKKVIEEIYKKKYKIICINDHLEKDYGTVLNIIEKGLNDIFKEKSSYEL